MKILSLFDGISCARVALERAGIKVQSYYSSEIDKYAIQISKKNYPDIKQLGDVKKVGFNLLNKDAIEYGYGFSPIDIDLLIGGSPCQDLSIAKKDRKGLDGERSGLFWEYVRILKEVKPKYFILENVNSMPKEAKELITKTLGVEPIMINASLVSAQNRKRLFWVGKRVGLTVLEGKPYYEKVEMPQPEDRGILLKDILEQGDTERLKSYCIDANYFKGGKIGGTHQSSTRNYTIRLGQFNSGGQGDRVYSCEGKSVGLSALGGGRGAKTGLYAVGVASRTYPRTPNGEKRTKQIEIRKDEKANSMTSVSGDSMVMQDTIIRKLTPVECERLQGLPDNYTAYGKVLQEINIFGNMDTWKNVLSKTVKEKKKQISVHVSCTTNAIKDTEFLNSLSDKLKSVYCVIGNLSQKGGVETITTIGIGTETQNIQIRLESSTGQPLEVDTDIYEMLMENGDIETLWKNISVELSEEMKSYIISTLTNLIIGLKTSISVHEANTCIFIINLKNLLQNSSKTEQLVSKTEHTTSISSTQRYKCLGNAFNVDVVAHILSFIK